MIQRSLTSAIMIFFFGRYIIVGWIQLKDYGAVLEILGLILNLVIVRFGEMVNKQALVVNPIIVYSYVFLFNCPTVGQVLDSMMALWKGVRALRGYFGPF